MSYVVSTHETGVWDVYKSVWTGPVDRVGHRETTQREDLARTPRVPGETRKTDESKTTTRGSRKGDSYPLYKTKER